MKKRLFISPQWFSSLLGRLRCRNGKAAYCQGFAIHDIARFYAAWTRCASGFKHLAVVYLDVANSVSFRA